MLNPTQIDLEDGTAAEPSLSFILDPDTGIYRPGDNQIGFSAGGVERLNLSPTQLTAFVNILAPDGTVSLPSFTFSSQNNTGMYRPTTSEVAFACGGVERFRIATTAIQASAIYLGPDGTAASPAFSFLSDPNSGIFLLSPDTLAASVGGVSVLSIDTAELKLQIDALLPDGLVSKPSLSFDNDPDTGLYSIGANVLGISVGAVNIFSIDNTAITTTIPYRAPGGGAATPSYSFSNDTDSGMYRASANTVAFSCGGVNCLTITASEIDSNVPFVGPVGSVSDPTYSFSGDTDTGHYRFGANTIRFTAGGDDILEINSDDVSTLGEIRLISNGRFNTTRGTDVSSSGNMTLEDDGNVFLITGTTTINRIRDNNWEEGCVIYLHFDDVLTVRDGQSSTGAGSGLDLAGGADFVTSADDNLTLQLFDDRWREISRTVI